MLTPLSKGQFLTFNIANGVIFTASYSCLVMFHTFTLITNASVAPVIIKKNGGNNITYLMRQGFLSNIIQMEAGEYLVSSGNIVFQYSIFVMRLK